ncbi:MAG: metallophosphoesterase [Candidatus Hodarchaeota archaeon]
MRLILKNRYIIISSDSFKIIVLADLHLGLEQEKNRRSIRFAQLSQRVLENLFRDIEHENPTHVFILGDIKQSIGYKTSKEEFLLRGLFTFLSEHNIQCEIAQGNHDADITAEEYPNISISSPQGFIFPVHPNKSVGFAHGHAYPSKAYDSQTFLLILGHLHPAVQLSEEHVGAVYRLPAFLRTDCTIESFNSITKKYAKEEFLTPMSLQEILILPAYNEFLGSCAINFPQDAKRKGFCSHLVRTFDFEIILLDGTILGKASGLSPGLAKNRQR